MNHTVKTLSLLISIALTPAAVVHAQTTLKETTQKAILSNPEVLAKWHNFQSATAERSAANGGFLPSVNLNANVGEQRDRRITSSTTNRSTAGISLNQMLYDGFLTSNEVKRFDYQRLAKLYELQDTTEAVALEVVRAYADVIRYRKLVSLSEDNYVRHRAVFEQIQAKSKAGVSRRVDLEQISGRLALAESNLLTETSNLHDVSARFLRLVGANPDKNLENITALSKGIPADISNALQTAFNKHPALLGSIAYIQSAKVAEKARHAAYQPRLDLRARTDQGTNVDYVQGRKSNSSAELVVSWNILNGGSDKARVKQAAEQLNVARDIRDKTCRDIRQTLTIAFNDTRKLADQLNYLDQHQLSIEKARDAYRQQFDIGQRSLLDLLDTENELFQAKRSYANAEIELLFAYARTQAGMGTLHTSLGLSRLDADVTDTPKDDGEEAQVCPIDSPTLYAIDKDKLNLRAQEGLTARPIETPVTKPVSVEKAPQKMAVGDEKKAVSRTSILTALKGWREAWMSMNTESYIDFYSNNYVGKAGWKEARRKRLETAQNISLELKDIKFEMQDAQTATTSFRQEYRSALYSDIVQKTIYWKETDGKWKIVNEIVTGPKDKLW
jgi:adhesin transport system outer membrane protein